MQPLSLSRWAWTALAVAQAVFSLACWELRVSYGKDMRDAPWVALAPGLALAFVMLRSLRSTTPPRAGRFFLAGALVFTLLAAAAPRRAEYRPEGDEPWYFVIAESLVNDGDTIITREEVVERSVWYFVKPLPPDQVVEIRGQLRTAHWPALGALIAPAVWLHSRVLAELITALLMAVGAALGARGLARLWGSERAGIVSSAVVVGTAPLGQYALMVFPDPVGAALWLIALGLSVEAGGVVGGLAAGLVSGGIVWLKPSMGVVAAAGIVVAALAPSRPGRSLASVVAGMAAGLALGTASFVAVQLATVGQIPMYLVELKPGNAWPEFLSSLFEPGRGLVVHYPLWGIVLVAAVAAGAVQPSRRSLAGLALVTGAALFHVLLPCMIYDGKGSWAPPSRYWIPSLPVLIAALALEPGKVFGWIDRAWARPWARRTLGACAAVGAFTNVLMTLFPRLAFTDGPHWITRLLAVLRA